MLNKAFRYIVKSVFELLFDTFSTFSGYKCALFRRSCPQLSFGLLKVFLVEVSNRNYTHGNICIPRLHLGYKYT